MYITWLIFYYPQQFVTKLHTLRTERYDRHCVDDINKSIFRNWNNNIHIQNSYLLVPKVLIDNESTLVKVMILHRTVIECAVDSNISELEIIRWLLKH